MRYDELVARASDAEPTGRDDARRRPDAPLLHLGHRRGCPRWCSTRTPRYGIGHEVTAPLLARPDGRPTCTGRSRTRAGPRRPGASCSASGAWAPPSSSGISAGKLDADADPARSLERSRRHDVLRAADDLPRARADRPRRATTFARCGTARSAGEPLNPEVIRAWRAGAPGLTIYDGYGQTETVILVANFRAVPVRAGLDGQADARLRRRRRRRGRRSRPRRARRATSRVRDRPSGPSACSPGYWQDDDGDARRRSATAGTSPATAATMDEDGYFWFVGRSDDVITSAAYRIGPFEVESRAHRAPGRRRGGRRRQARSRSAARSSRPSSCSRPGHDGVRRARRASCRSTSRRVTAPYKYPREIELRRRAAQDDQRQDPPQRAARAPMTQLPPFAIERYFAVHEFAVPYLLCASDVEPLAMSELLAYGRRRDARALGRTGARLHRDARLAAPAPGDRGALRDARGRRRDRGRGRERGALRALLGTRPAGRPRDRAVAGVPVAVRPRARAGRRRRADRAAARGRLGARPRPDRRRHAPDDPGSRRQPAPQPDRHAPRACRVRRAGGTGRAPRRDARVRRGLPRSRAGPGRPAPRGGRSARTVP